MSNEPLDAESRKAVDDFTRSLRQKSRAERERILQRARQEALQEELEDERQRSEQLADEMREGLTRDTPRQEALAARRTSPRDILLLLMLLIILLLISVATGRGTQIRFPASGAPANGEPTLSPQIPSGQSNPQFAVGASANSGGNPAQMPQIGSLNQPAPSISPRFRAFYDQHGGERVFGQAISPELNVNGRSFQWFERARLEDWPEYAGTPYAVQGGLVGREFTKDVVFPKQIFFVSQTDIRYFGETAHGLRDPFLSFWEQNGGLDILGYPIGDEVLEELPQDGQIHTVQYFERGRLEYHPEQAGTPFEVQLGLLGRALYLENSKPKIITPVAPTPVPVH
jgi:hypothetical protein